MHTATAPHSPGDTCRMDDKACYGSQEKLCNYAKMKRIGG